MATRDLSHCRYRWRTVRYLVALKCLREHGVWIKLGPPKVKK